MMGNITDQKQHVNKKP